MNHKQLQKQLIFKPFNESLTFPSFNFFIPKRKYILATFQNKGTKVVSDYLGSDVSKNVKSLQMYMYNVIKTTEVIHKVLVLHE